MIGSLKINQRIEQSLLTQTTKELWSIEGEDFIIDRLSKEKLNFFLNLLRDTPEPDVRAYEKIPIVAIQYLNNPEDIGEFFSCDYTEREGKLYLENGYTMFPSDFAVLDNGVFKVHSEALFHRLYKEKK